MGTEENINELSHCQTMKVFEMFIQYGLLKNVLMGKVNGTCERGRQHYMRKVNIKIKTHA